MFFDTSESQFFLPLGESREDDKNCECDVIESGVERVTPPPPLLLPRRRRRCGGGGVDEIDSVLGIDDEFIPRSGATSGVAVPLDIVLLDKEFEGTSVGVVVVEIGT